MKYVLQRKVEHLGNQYFLISAPAGQVDLPERIHTFGGVPVEPCFNRPTGWVDVGAVEEVAALLCKSESMSESLEEGQSYELE